MSAGTGRYAAIHFVAKSRRRQIAVTMEHKSGNIGNWKSGLYPTEISDFVLRGLCLPTLLT